MLMLWVFVVGEYFAITIQSSYTFRVSAPWSVNAVLVSVVKQSPEGRVLHAKLKLVTASIFNIFLLYLNLKELSDLQITLYLSALLQLPFRVRYFLPKALQSREKVLGH